MNLKDFLPKNIGEMSRVVSNPYAHSFAPFKEEDLDEELKEGFGGELKGAAKRKFETERKKNAEVLGYKMVPEASVTGNLDGGEGPPKTPYAFQSTKKKRKKDKEKEKKISTNSTGYTIAEDIYVALVSKTGRQFTGKQPRFNPRNLGHPGLLVTTADKIFKSEVGRNLSQKLASKLKITKRYNQKGLQGSKKTADRGTRQYIDAIGGVIKSKMVPEIPNGRTMPVTKRLDLVFANSQSQLDNVLKGKYKVVKESVNEKVNKSDLKYQLDMSLDNLGIGTKALIVMKPKGKDFFLKMKSYMYQDSMEAVLKDANKNLDSKLKIKDFKKTRMGTEFIIGEGTCGYGIDGKIGEEPAGPNLMKKIKKISKDKEKKKILKSKKEGVNERLNQSQAKTLLRQLGGNKFIMMTGAKQMSIGKNGLTMKIGRNSKSITHVAIDLDRGKDLYIMKFIRVRKGIPKVVKQYDGIYADNLNNIFEKETGLYTRL